MNLDDMVNYSQQQDELVEKLGKEFTKRRESADKLEADKVEYLRIIATNTSEILKILQNMNERV